MLNAACPLHKVKRRSSLNKKKTIFGPQFFLQVKYETWISFGLQKPNANYDSFAPFKP